MNVLTIAALVVLLFCILRGWKRGIVMWIYGAAAWVFIMLFVTIAHNVIFNMYMENEKIHGRVVEVVRPYVEGYIPNKTEGGIDIDDAMSTMGNLIPEELPIDGSTLSNVDADVLRDFGINIPEEYDDVVNDVIDRVADGADTVGGLTEQINDGASGVGDALRQATVDVAAETVTQYALRILAVLTAYVIAKVICTIVKIALVVLTENKLIRTPVHMAGAVLGAAEGVMYIWVALYGIRMLALTDIGAIMVAEVHASPFLSALDQNNMLAGFFENMLGL